MGKKVLVACQADESKGKYSRRDYVRILNYAAQDKIRKYTITNDPDDAELILFVGSSEVNFTDIRQSNIYLKYRHKSVLYFSGDKLVPLLPGLYPCLEANRFGIKTLSRASSYYLRVTDNTTLDIEQSIHDAKYLFSFMGNCANHPIRKKLMGLSHQRAFLYDSSTTRYVHSDYDNATYLESLEQSEFVLCPRGIGVSSWRLFETMRAGRVPVIISDNWIEPAGPNWSTCSIRIKESDINSIVSLLEEHEDKACQFAANARKEWERYYSSETVFNSIITQAENCLIAARTEGLIHRLTINLNYLKPFFIRHWVLSPIKAALIRRFKN